MQARCTRWLNFRLAWGSVMKMWRSSSTALASESEKLPNFCSVRVLNFQAFLKVSERGGSLRSVIFIVENHLNASVPCI